MANDDFVRNLTHYQNSLYAYILALWPDHNRAADVLQDANVVMWRKADQFVPGTDFLAWARKIVWYEILAHRQRQRSDRHVFDSQLLELLATDAETRLNGIEDRMQVLDHCLDQLTAHQRDLIHQRYAPGASVNRLAAERGQSAAAISVTLTRIRRALVNCVRRKLAQESR